MNHEHQPDPHERDLTMSDEDAQASGPEDESVCGEEDPGSALEDLVTRKDNAKNKV
ncbi:hypothetical protein [Alteromonas aestuariivivens]|uniref:hypothetical protein n=1 Tax=Alteromonas aestuariivivens TaxID=1938339 RepID=UPI0015F29A05|nr:hypothetical protein [Alteromonas aestuariivivens]